MLRTDYFYGCSSNTFMEVSIYYGSYKKKNINKKDADLNFR